MIISRKKNTFFNIYDNVNSLRVYQTCCKGTPFSSPFTYIIIEITIFLLFRSLISIATLLNLTMLFLYLSLSYESLFSSLSISLISLRNVQPLYVTIIKEWKYIETNLIRSHITIFSLINKYNSQKIVKEMHINNVKFKMSHLIKIGRKYVLIILEDLDHHVSGPNSMVQYYLDG